MCTYVCTNLIELSVKKYFVHRCSKMPLTDTWLKRNLDRERSVQHVEADQDGLSVRVSPKGKLTFQMRCRKNEKHASLDLGT